MNKMNKQLAILKNKNHSDTGRLIQRFMKVIIISKGIAYETLTHAYSQITIFRLVSTALLRVPLVRVFTLTL